MKPRILFYDIETTDLDADFGHCLAFGYKVLGEKKAHVLSLLDVDEPCDSCGRVDATDDSELMASAWVVLAAADMWVTWYGKGFDAKFLNTRILDAKLPPLPAVPHVDLYWTARSNLKLSSNRLASVQDFLQLPTSKTPLTKRVWRKAQAGDVESLRYIVDHCRKDVMVLEEAYHRLKPYVRQHPRIGRWGECRVCGSERVTRNAMRVTVTKGKREQLVCRECGHCETRPLGSQAR